MGWVQRGGGETFIWWGQEDAIAMIFPPSHLLCTIKSQMGTGGGNGVNGVNLVFLFVFFSFGHTRT